MTSQEPEDPFNAFMRGEEITHISGAKIKLPDHYIQFIHESIAGSNVAEEMAAFIKQYAKERKKYVSLKRTTKTLEDLLVKEKIFNQEMHELLEQLEKENESLKKLIKKGG